MQNMVLECKDGLVMWLATVQARANLGLPSMTPGSLMPHALIISTKETIRKLARMRLSKVDILAAPGLA